LGWITIGDLDKYEKRVEMARGRGRARIDWEEHMRRERKKNEKLSRED
jgi:hypothetical protein